MIFLIIFIEFSYFHVEHFELLLAQIMPIDLLLDFNIETILSYKFFNQFLL